MYSRIHASTLINHHKLRNETVWISKKCADFLKNVHIFEKCADFSKCAKSSVEPCGSPPDAQFMLDFVPPLH